MLGQPIATYAVGSSETSVAAQQPSTGTNLPPVMSGTVRVTPLYDIGIAWDAASDDISVTGYEISVDSGSPSWNDVGNVLQVYVNSLNASTYNVRVRAYDAAGNRSNILSTTISLGVQPAPLQGTVRFSFLPRSKIEILRLA